MPKPKSINLYILKKDKNSIRSLRGKVLEFLGNSVYDCKTKQDFVYAVLKGLYPVNKSLTNDVISIEKACEKIFKLLPIRKATLIRIDDDGTRKEITSKDDDLAPMQRFLQIYLQFETSPGITYQQLQQVIKDDMISINELIKWYEAQPFIQKHLSSHNQPRNQNERTLFDYYYRCIKEQKIVTDYYLAGIKQRAVAKANYWGSLIKSFASYTEPFRDRPYYFARNLSLPYFDCRQIDLVSNKISDIPIDEALKLESLYNKNKQLFYRKLFKKNKPAALIQELRFYLAYLPMQNDRKPIFDELEKLFKRKSWIGYYSLALTQIEGLFSEMYSILNPSSETNRKSLPDKVQFARPFHEMSDVYFDYYQYHIPVMRNKFMHSGYDENFKLKSYDLLFDLRHLMKLFYELDNPMVKIKRLHTARKFEDFITYAEFAKYFNLLNGLTKKQHTDISADIKKFETEFLIPYCSAEYVCLEIAQELQKELKKFLEEVDSRLASKGKSFDFSGKNITKLIEAVKADAELAGLLSDCYNYRQHETEALLAYHIFLNNYRKYLPSLNKDYAKILGGLNQKYGVILSSISKIKSILPIEEV